MVTDGSTDMVMSVFSWAQVVLVESVGGLARIIALLVAIILPLMIVMELLKEYAILERLSGRAEPFARWLGLTGRAAFPLVAGLVFGIAYGAGVILESAREGGLSHRDRYLLCVFLVACHAVIEDTLLFVPFGVNPLLLLGARLLPALAITVFASRFIRDGDLPQSQ